MRFSWMSLGIAVLVSGCGAEATTSAFDASATPDASPAQDSGPVDAGGAADAEMQEDAAVEDAGAQDAAVEDGGAAADAGTASMVVLGGDRPANMKVPAGYDGSPLPLVILLHGYTVDGATQDFYFGLSSQVDTRNFFLILPDGTREASAAQNRFWNATSACCNFYGSPVDDVAYLTSLIDEASQRFNIDPARVHLVGHSNGGFMAHRMACDVAPRIASIVSLAGVEHFDETLCDAVSPVSVLQIHGTADTTIGYAGVATGPMQYPGSEETALRWATRAGCTVAQTEDGADINLDTALPGDETEVLRYSAGCTAGIEVELWRIVNGGHIPALPSDFASRVLDFIEAHPKP